MGYMSKNGRRPNELASKTSHIHIVNDPVVESFINDCVLPKSGDEVDFPSYNMHSVQSDVKSPINHVFAIDGGYTEIFVKNEFPSSNISFFQFGASGFSMDDLNEIANKAFISPDDISKLKNIERFKLVLPTKNIIIKSEKNLTNSVRTTIYNFFMNEPKEQGDSKKSNFLKTLSWFLFEEYREKELQINKWNLSTCPCCGSSNINLIKETMSTSFTFQCTECKDTIYLTDVFRLHEAIDNELGAGGILGYLTNLLEHVILIHLIKTVLEIKKSLLNEMLLIKDGPLGFFGQTANLHKPMRSLTNYLLTTHNLFLAGLEKSGAFVEHANEISKEMKPDTFLLLNNKYIYKYIIPGDPESKEPYARTSYYSGKLIYKSKDDRMYVVTVPIDNAEILIAPKITDYKNIDVILKSIEKLKCDMYDNALIPIALVNKLVSLSNHPSSVILEKFAKKSIG
ncbi:DNA double-strand break repair nuclease NurA [Paenibacillus ottowii]|uniref:NurA domain-containing protein n=1 Tax=Paenibacillus ottowii TaxID=2315729 RepID=A0ABY3B458_9BACL|nr:DNA double-strand break repair nuclease NurA [Paenibacillus ottowii]TQR98219.1 NurA domain-containing protein [Paenibacillus ottowii]